MTARKDPAQADVFRDVRTSIARAHAWLNANSSGLPAATETLTAAQAELLAMQCRNDPELLARFGAPTGEEPGSQCGLVRRFLLECVATTAAEERPRLAAEHTGKVEAAFFDDEKTRKALPRLESGLAAVTLLLEEANSREVALVAQPIVNDFDTETRELARHTRAAILRLIQHLRTSMGVVPPRTLAEFGLFRATWARRLHGSGFSYAEIEAFLGYDLPTDPTARARLRASIRKNCRRHVRPGKLAHIVPGT